MERLLTTPLVSLAFISFAKKRLCLESIEFCQKVLDYNKASSSVGGVALGDRWSESLTCSTANCRVREATRAPSIVS